MAGWLGVATGAGEATRRRGAALQATAGRLQEEKAGLTAAIFWVLLADSS